MLEFPYNAAGLDDINSIFSKTPKSFLYYV